MKPLTLAALAVVGAMHAFPAQAATVSLTGSNSGGYLAFDRFNNEVVEPNSGLPGSKDFDYPYYFDPSLGSSGLWVMLVADKLSADSIYPQESQFTVYNKTVTDADFSISNIGSVSFADGLLSGVGQEVIGTDQLTLTLSDSDYSPLPKPRNVDNEFAWTYTLTPSNLQGAGLTFLDGVLTSIDFVADLKVDVNFLGNTAPPFRMTPGFSQSNALTFSGGSFAFSFDVVQTQNSALGVIENPRLVLNRFGSVDQVTPVPEPSTYLLMLAGVGVLAIGSSVRARRRREPETGGMQFSAA